MPINLEQMKPIDPDDKNYAKMLESLQGNILKSHGRSLAVHILLQFSDDTTAVKKWLAEFSAQFVTSARRQLQEAQKKALDGVSGPTFGAIYISASGYSKLGFDPGRFVEAKLPNSPSVFFKNGMKGQVAELNDPPPEKWEEAYREEIDAMLLLADANKDPLDAVRGHIESSLFGIATILTIEDVEQLRDGEGKPIEHFGYRDGISQPLYFQTDVKEDEQQFGIDPWDPSAPLSLVLVDDPFDETKDSFGSYVVFRKLEQNVAEFDMAAETLAGVLGLPPEATNKGEHMRAGALIVGRYKNGVPVELSKTEDAPLLREVNNFDYRSDFLANKCPFQAHIRKANPRFGTADTNERRRRITRRGITYGARTRSSDGTFSDSPETGVGLLFMCFQSSIPSQFAFIQRKWANNPLLAEPGGMDPIIGQINGSHNAIDREWPPEWGATQRNQCTLSKFVTLKGGEYFFAPSLPFLLNLA